MNQTSFLGLLQNTALLLALVLIFDTSNAKLRPELRTVQKLGVGALIGFIGALIMLTPWVLIPGVVFDTRSVLLGVSGVFFGAVPTFAAMAVTAAVRIAQGGDGALTGVLVILATGSLGLAWRRADKRPLETRSWWEFYLFGVVSHLVMLALMLTLPRETALRVLGEITVPVLVLYPIGTMVLAMLMKRRLVRERAADALRLSEESLKTAAAELEHSRDILLKSQEIAHVGTWEFDHAAGELVWTPEVYRICGLEPERGGTDYDTFLELVHPEDREAVDRAFRDSIHSGNALYAVDHRVVRPATGEIRFVREECVHVRDENGTVIRSIGMIQDITGERLAQDRMSGVLREKERLIQELSHRTYNNMQVIQALLYYRASAHPDASVEECAEATNDRIGAIALGHRELIRSDNLSRIDLGVYIGQLAETAQRRFPDTAERVALSYDAEPALVLLDTAIPAGLAVYELILNALTHAFPNGRSGTLRISVHRTGDSRIAITVADDGAESNTTRDGLDAGAGSIGLAAALIEDQLKGSLRLETGAGTRWFIEVADDLYQERV